MQRIYGIEYCADVKGNFGLIKEKMMSPIMWYTKRLRKPK